jgi:hypothetical protein
MTAVWGPLGWMTLHSVSTIYPERPTQSEKDLLTTWLGLFTETITCPYCRDHFRIMHANYRAKYPGYLDSRQAFAMFAFRCHNVVNARLSKPVYATLEDCMARLRETTKLRSAQDYRISYVNHLTRFWSTMQDTSGIAALKKVYEMKKIEVDYFGPRDTKFDVQLRDDGVVIPRHWVEHIPGGQVPEVPTPRLMPRPNDTTRAGFRMQGGRMRLF